MNAWTGRVFCLSLALGYFGVIPSSVLVATSKPALLPLAVLASGVAGLWGANYLWASIPSRSVDNATVARVRAQVAAVCERVGIAEPTVIVSRRATRAGVTWCQDQPSVIFPAHWVERMDEEELRAYAAHEIAHQTQPRYRRLGVDARIVQLSGGAVLGIGFVILTRARSIEVGSTPLIAYCVLPLALTVVLMGRTLLRRRSMERIEVEADEQAVAWDASAQALASVVGRLERGELRAPSSPDQRLLMGILTLPASPRVGALRLRRLHELIRTAAR